MLLESGPTMGFTATTGGSGTNFAGSGYPAAVTKTESTRKVKSKDTTTKVVEKVKPPPQKGPIFLYYADLTEADLVQVANAKTKAEVRQLLREFMKIDEEEGFRMEILCDFHYHNYAFCVERGFTIDKISTFLSVMKHTLDEAVTNKLLAGGAFTVFKDWLLRHSVERPPWSVGIFTHDDVKEITSYVHNTFIRHYQLYMYIYMIHCDIDVHTECRTKGGFSQARPTQPLEASCEVTSTKSPDDVYLELLRDFKVDPHIAKLHPEWMPLAEPPVLGNAEDELEQDDRAAVIKRKVEEGVKELLVKFEEKLQDQDEQFRQMQEG